MPKVKKETKPKNSAKEPVKKAVKKAEKKEAPKIKVGKFLEATGRRKSAIARVRIYPNDPKDFIVNGKPLEQYFPIDFLRQTVFSPLEKMDLLNKFKVSVVVKGGGLTAQSEAIRHGVARALVLLNPEARKDLKSSGYLTRDPRARERKKPGLKRARRAPQWKKR